MSQIKTKFIENLAVTNAKVATDAVTAVKIAADAVTTVKILDSNVTANKLASDSVTTVKILDSNVTNSKLATDSVTAIKIAADAVTTVKILDGNVTNVKLASGIDATKIADGSVTNAEFQYINSLSSNAQDQIDGKVNKAGDTMTGTLAMGVNKVTSSYIPDANNVLTNKLYVDGLVAGAVWLSPIIDPDLINDSLAVDPGFGSVVVGDVYIAAATNGGWVTGHAYFSDGSQWVDLLGRAVIAGDRFGVSMESVTAGAGGLASQDNKIATIVSPTPGSITYTFETPASNHAVYVSNDISSHAGHQYNYNGSTWVEFGGLVAVNAGIGLELVSNVLNVKLGAGIAQLPSDEVGIDVHSAGGLMTSVDNSTSSTVTGAQLAIKLDGSTLSKSASGLSVALLGITNAEVSNSAAIAYSKLALSNSIVNADINASAAIAYSKLNLTGAILNADLAGSIDATKIADGSVTNAEFQYINSLTSNAQTQLNDKASTTLNNLGATAINASLLPAITDDSTNGYLGNISKRWYEARVQYIYARSVNVGSGFAQLHDFTTTMPSGTSATLNLSIDSQIARVFGLYSLNSADVNANATSQIRFETGNKTAGTGNSGNILFQTGTSLGGARGEISLDGLQINVNSKKIVNLADPTVAQDAATKAYVDSQIGAFNTAAHEEITLSAGDITNEYFALANNPGAAASIMVIVGGVIQRLGIDFSLTSSNHINFGDGGDAGLTASDLDPTSGQAALIAGDKVYVYYRY